jgi:ArsR family transcriptional regulator
MLPPAQFFKCLSDDTRCKLLLLVMEEKELCVCEFSHALNTSQPKISRHLAQLRAAGLLVDRRQGQWVYYRIKPATTHWTHQLLSEFYQVKKDHITQELDRLHSMGDRPKRQKEFC